MKTVIYARVINSVSDEPIENGMVEIEDDHIVYVGEKRECTDSDAQMCIRDRILLIWTLLSN